MASLIEILQTFTDNSIKRDSFEITFADGGKLIGIPIGNSVAMPTPDQIVTIKLPDGSLMDFKLSEIKELSKQ